MKNEIKVKFEENKLGEDQMEFVAGGNINECYADARFLSYMKIADLWCYIAGNFDSMPKYKGRNPHTALKAAWKEVGIICKTSNTSKTHNIYYLAKNNERITREEAWAFAEEYARTH